MIHPLSDVKCSYIPKSTNVWQFCVILPNAKIGENCNINMNVFIENEVSIGNDVTVKSGVQIWDGIIIEDNVFIGPNVTFINDKYPRSKEHQKSIPKTIVKKGVSIGANSTIMCGITIEENCIIGAGSVLTKSTNKHEIWFGNPAQKKRNI